MSRSWVLLACAFGCAPGVDGEVATAARAGQALITAAAELSVPRPPGMSTTPGAQRAAVIHRLSSMSSNYVVLWEDNRSGELDLYSAIVDMNGARISGPNLVAGQVDHQHDVAVACGGGQPPCFAVWVDERFRLLFGAPLDVDGKVMGMGRALVSRVLDEQVQPAIAWLANDSYLIAWVETRNLQRDLYVALVGATSGATGGRIPVEDRLPRLSLRPSLAVSRAMGVNALLTWEEAGTGIVGTRLETAMLRALDDPPLAISAPANSDAGVAWPVAEPALNHFQVVWAERRPDWDLFGATVFFDGGVTAARALNPTPGDQFAPSLNGSYVVWTDNRNGQLDVYGSQLISGAAPQDSRLVSGVGDQELPAVLSEGTSAIAVWTDGRGLDGWPDIYASRFIVPFGASVLTRNLVSEFPPEAQSVAVASQRSVDLLVWEDSRDPNGSLDVYGVLVADGRPDAGFPIATGLGPQAQPAVAAGPDNDFFVAFSDGPSRQIKGVTVSGPLVVPLSTSLSGAANGVTQAQPAVAWNGTHYTIVFVELPASRLSYALYSGGTGAPPVFPVRGTGGLEQQPAIAASVSSHIALIAWAEKAPLGLDIYARRLDPSGSPADLFTLPLAVGLGDQQEPAVGTDGRDFLVVWRDGRGAGASDLWGMRVPATGPPTDLVAVQLTDGPAAEVRPAVAHDGKDWVVSWQDHGDAAGVAIWAERLAPDLSHYAAERVASGQRPAISIGPGSAGLIGYHRPVGAPTAHQAFMKRVLAPGGASCVGGSSCQSGACSAGVCGDVDGGSPVRFDAGVIFVPDGGVAVEPRIIENANASAAVGSPYRYNAAERVELERGTPPVTFGACDTPPSDFVVDPGTGFVKWTPATPGVQPLCVFATNGLRDEYRFEVTVAAVPDGGVPPQGQLDFQARACECGTSGGLLAFAALFSLFGKRRRATSPCP